MDSILYSKGPGSKEGHKQVKGWVSSEGTSIP